MAITSFPFIDTTRKVNQIAQINLANVLIKFTVKAYMYSNTGWQSRNIKHEFIMLRAILPRIAQGMHLKMRVPVSDQSIIGISNCLL